MLCAIETAGVRTPGMVNGRSIRSGKISALITRFTGQRTLPRSVGARRSIIPFPITQVLMPMPLYAVFLSHTSHLSEAFGVRLSFLAPSTRHLVLHSALTLCTLCLVAAPANRLTSGEPARDQDASFESIF